MPGYTARLLVCIPVFAAMAFGAFSQPWRTTVTRAGDTTAVRNTGTNTKAADATLMSKYSITGDDIPGTPGFRTVTMVQPAIDGGVFIYDQGVIQITRFDNKGKFVQHVGRRGSGPGEYERLGSIVATPDGRLHTISYSGGQVTTYSQLGVVERSWPRTHIRPLGSFSLVAVRADGRLEIRTAITDPRRPDSLNAFGQGVPIFAVLGMQTPGSGPIDTSLPPRPARTLKRITYKSGRPLGGNFTLAIPLERYFLAAYSSDGYWIGADQKSYALLLHKPGGLLRVESDYNAPAAGDEERKNLLENQLYSERRIGSQFDATFSVVPKVKPHFKSIRTDVDGRIWVELHRAGAPAEQDTTPLTRPLIQSTVNGQPNPNQPVVSPNAPRAPTVKWVEPIVYDVFKSSGEFIGRVSLPPRSTFGNSKGNKLWLIQRDMDDVASVVCYEVVAGLPW